MELEILEYTGEGYDPTMHFGAWRVALMNYAESLERKNFTQMERHMCTDEVFVLLYGSATLVIGEEKREYPMEKGKIYNVKQGVWHQILFEKDTRVLIVENHDTVKENSEYMQV